MSTILIDASVLQAMKLIQKYCEKHKDLSKLEFNFGNARLRDVKYNELYCLRCHHFHITEQYMALD